MKNLILLILSIFLCASLSAQINSWTLLHDNPLNGFNHQPVGHLIEKENSIITLSARTFRELSYSGEVINQFDLDDNAVNGSSFYFFMDELVTGGTEYIFTAHRGGSSGNIYLYTYLKDGTPGISFTLDDNIPDDELKSPAGVKTNEGDYLFFGQDQIYKVAVTDAYTINITGTFSNTGGIVAAAANTGDGFISVSNMGIVNKYDENINLVWSQDLGYPLTDIIQAEDGYLISGNESPFAKITRTNATGDQIWEQPFDSTEIFGITSTAEQDFLLTGKKIAGNNSTVVIKTNTQGSALWTKNYDIRPGINIMESRYGGILLQCNSKVLSGSINLLDNQGNIGPYISGDETRLLDVNNITTTTSPSGALFNDDSFNIPYRFPKDSLTSTMFVSNLWMGGYDQNNNLRAISSMYNSSGYQAGPWDNTNTEFWSRIWAVSQKMIYDVTTDLSDGTQDAPIPQDLLNWPAFGNPNIVFNGEPVTINQNVAPFEDVNNDGIYNIYDGDYPIIKGDKMLWWVMTDSDFSLPIGIEITGNFYAFECEDDIIHNATFLELDIINKTNTTYSDMIAGLFTDFDIGCFTNDRFGSLPNLNSYYAYNATTVDGPCQSGYPSFTDDIPIQSITLLNNEMENFIHTLGIVDNPPSGMLDPNTYNQIYNYLNGIWIDDIPLTSGGIGYDPGGNNMETDYAYPGNPAVSSEWSMCTSTSFIDARSIASTPTFTFSPGDTFSLHYGMLTHTGIEDLPCPDISQIESNLVEFQNIYDNYIATGTISGLALDLGPDLLFNDGDVFNLDAGPGGTAYLWSTGETTQSITVDMPGTYSVTVTTGFGCDQTDEINIDQFISTKDLAATALKIYPNPSAGLINIQLGDEVPQELKLYNSIGQQVQNINTKTFVANRISSVDLSKHTTGIYFLACRYADGKRSVQQVVLE